MYLLFCFSCLFVVVVDCLFAICEYSRKSRRSMSSHHRSSRSSSSNKERERASEGEKEEWCITAYLTRDVSCYSSRKDMHARDNDGKSCFEVARPISATIAAELKGRFD
jgi:hypothetical protein